MKRIIASSVLITAALFPNFVQAEDNSYPLKMTVTNPVEIHSGATTSYRLIDSLNEGYEATVIAEFTNSLGETWYRVDLGKNKGWGIASKFAAKTTEQPADTGAVKGTVDGKSGIVKGNYVNIRSGATTSYKIVGQLMNNQSIKILSSFTNANGELWYRIDTGKVQGWVIKDFITVQSNQDSNEKEPVQSNEKIIEADSAVIRSGASNNYRVVKQLYKNDKVTILQEFTNSLNEKWYQAKSGNVTGWINSTAFDKTEVSPMPPETNPVEERLVLQEGSVRSGASNNYRVVGTVLPNQTIKVFATFTNSLGEKWVQTEINGTKGWVSETIFTKAETPNPEPQPEPTPPPSDLPSIGAHVYTKVNNAEVRSGASLNYKIVSTLNINSKLEVLDTFINSLGESWIRVKVNASITGWIPYTQVDKEALKIQDLYISVDTANLRNGPSLSSSVVTQAKKGTPLKAIAQTGEWYQVVTQDNQTVWAHQSVVTSQAINITKFISSSTASVRSGASDGYKVVETLKKNNPVVILQYFTNSLNQKWVQVKTPSGKNGWILESQTSFESTNQLTNPTFNNGTLSWTKPSDVTIKYDTLSNNRLKISGDMSTIEKPNFSIKGIKGIETAVGSVVITFEPGYTFTIRNNKNDVSVKVLPTGLAGKKIIVDAGHGGHDVGAVGPSGVREKDVNLATALKLKTELERAGAIVRLTRSTDVFLELSERTAISNSSDYDAFISIHSDSFSSTSKGSTTYLNTTVNFNGLKSKGMADAVQKNLISSLGTYNRGVKEQRFYVNRMNELPSILVELAFISNPNEEKLLNSSAFQQKAAAGITKGLQEYFSSF